MSQADLLALLLGPLGLLVGSLLLNYLQGKGHITSRNVVHKEQYDTLLSVNAAYAERFKEQTTVIQRLVSLIEDRRASP